jgi:hypothetical protein
MNKLLFATASAAIVYGAVAASAQGLPFMLHATTDQPSYVDQLPTRAQSANQAEPSDLQRGRLASRGIAPGLASMAEPSGR